MVSQVRLGNGRFETTAFNSRLQPTQIGLGYSATDTGLLKLGFAYNTAGQNDNNGNVLSQTITAPTEVRNNVTYSGFTATQTYTYDSLNRIRDAREMIGTTQQWKQTFDYDRYGNRRFDEANTTTIQKNCTDGSGAVVCAGDVPVVNPTINTANNRLDGYTFDDAGNTKIDAMNRQFIYDAENKQIEVKDSQSTSIGKYYYDGDGKRVKKVVPATGETTIFIYDASGKMVAEYSTVTNNNPQVSYLTSDHLGSPRINTDASGEVTARHDYQPFGEEIARASYGNDDVRNRYTSYERDVETSLDYAKARMHNYNYGRFTSVDPIMMSKDRLPDPQAINLYVYARNNPLRFTDPDGKKFVDEDGNKIKVKRNKKTGEIEVKAGKKTDPKSKALADLQRMAGLVNKSGSKTAANQFMEVSKNKTKVHFSIETERTGRPSLNGVHEAHDKNGAKLSWDSSTGKFNDKPAYNKDGSYKEASITIFEGSINNNLDSTRLSFGDPNITKDEAIVSVFGHEAEHNLNKRDIAEIKGRYEGKGNNYDVDLFDPINQRYSASYQISIAIFAEIP